MDFRRPTSPKASSTRRRRARGEAGFTLVEMLVVMAVMLVVVGATMAALEQITRAQARDQAYGDELAGSQVSFARLTHDLRQATVFQSLTPNSVQFQMIEGGTTYNVAYSCSATDSLGSGYTRCAQTQAVAPAAPAAAGGAAGSLDIQHVTNGTKSSFCVTNPDGSTSPSGSVFFPENPSIANTDGSGLTCDESYERELASLTGGTTYMQLTVQVPASGDLKSGGLNHTVTLSSGVFLPNLDAGS